MIKVYTNVSGVTTVGDGKACVIYRGGMERRFYSLRIFLSTFHLWSAILCSISFVLSFLSFSILYITKLSTGVCQQEMQKSKEQ